MLTIKKKTRVMRIKTGQGSKEVYMGKNLSWAILLRASQLQCLWAFGSFRFILLNNYLVNWWTP